ncbi:MAG: hypothetical protein Q9195_008969 [Heterodermia aff. obscurata]
MEGGSVPSHDIRFPFRAPTFQTADDTGGIALQDIESGDRISTSEQGSNLKRRPKTIAFEEDHTAKRKSDPDVYLGSYGKISEHTRSSTRASIDVKDPYVSVSRSPRASTSHVQLEQLRQAIDVDIDTYGLSELRDGFFDASFHRPRTRAMDFDGDNDDIQEHLPAAFRRYHPLSIRRFIPQQWREFREFVLQMQNFSLGTRMLKTFLGYFIAYIICLIPISRDRLGKYNYIMVISTIVNHSGRPLGSQIDGAFMTILGTVAGLGWGSLALYISTSTGPARAGYGGVLATFLVIFAAAIAWLRCMFMRFFQAVICAGIAICYTCLADTSEAVGWRKVFNYGIPWLFGQALCLIVSACIFPDTGSRSLAKDDPTLRRDLAWTFVKLSGAVRDFTVDMTVSPYHPDDTRSLRNLIQGVIRSVLSIRPETTLFDVPDGVSESRSGAMMLSACEKDSQGKEQSFHCDAALGVIVELLRKPTREIIDAVLAAINHCDAILTRIGGVKKFNNESEHQHDIAKVLGRLQSSMDAFDAADKLLLHRAELPPAFATSPEIIEIFLFVHPVRQAADKVQQLLRKVVEVRRKNRGWRVNLPTYPFIKSLDRVNAQVRHDRGGLTAGFYFRTKEQLERTMADLQHTSYIPRAHSVAPTDDRHRQIPHSDGHKTKNDSASNRKKRDPAAVSYRHLVWRFLHRLQDFESRFAFKVALVTTLLSIPAWLHQSRGWWNDFESWFAVVTVWMMMHPRVGGTFQDLATRSLCAALGAIWGGLAWAAGRGNPYVQAVFAALFMFPMLHRFTQSRHPRSGIVGCLSFTVISLGAYTNNAQPSIIQYTWTRGVAFIVGVVAALMTNWILWPFIARHELRKSISTMMLHSAILYRGVVARYIYYTENNAPGPADIQRSEMLEGRLREGFVRMRQLLELTRHEIRLRAPFDPVPYSELIDTCERFFEDLVEVRQSSIYFQPFMLARGAAAANALFEVRRDAVAVILFNLYTLACALRADQPVPKYLPSAAAARRRLLEKMEAVEKQYQEMEMEKGLETVGGVEPRSGTGRRWADVYQYAFSSALTDIVEELQLLQRWTKKICGEVGFDSEIEAGDGEDPIY